MKINQAGLELIKEFECGGNIAKYLTSYIDCVGVWTIGYGTTGDRVYPGLIISEATAEQWLAEDMQHFELAVQRLVKVDLNENQFSALVSFAYNCGENALAQSTALKRLNKGDYTGCVEALQWWNKGSSGEVLPGLTRRRKAEGELFSLEPKSAEKNTSAKLSAPLPQSFLLNTYRYFGDLPHQKQAIVYLEQHTPADVLQDMQKIWRSSPVQTIAKPKTLIDKIIAYYQLNGWKLFDKPGEINICYLKDADEFGVPHQTKPNEFDDRRILFTKRDGQWTILLNATATCDPGQYWVENPMNPQGAAQIKLDTQFTAWQVGTHGHGNYAHEALVQVGTITVVRDSNESMSRDGSDVEDTGDDFGVNQHSAFDAPIDEIGRWSAGCLVGRHHESHQKFMRICKSDPRYQQDDSFTFTTVVINTQKMLQQV